MNKLSNFYIQSFYYNHPLESEAWGPFMQVGNQKLQPWSNNLFQHQQHVKTYPWNFNSYERKWKTAQNKNADGW